MGRVLGLDLGTVRIGVAVSDSEGRLAVAREVISRGASRKEDFARVAALVEETGATRVVVGLPVSLDGSSGPAARKVEREVTEMRASLAVPVLLFDERLSSVEAARRRREARSEGRRGSRGRIGSRDLPVDAAAAAIVLQAYLDSAKGA